MVGFRMLQRLIEICVDERRISKDVTIEIEKFWTVLVMSKVCTT